MKPIRVLALLLLLPAAGRAYSTYGTYVPPEGLGPAPTPVAVVDATLPGTWSVSLGGGAALPLGALAQDNGAGGSAMAGVRYQLTPWWDLDLRGLYASMPYTTAGGGSPDPLSVGGPALKADLRVFSADQTTAWIGAGVGVFGVQATQHQIVDPGSYPVVYRTVAQGELGLGLLGAFGLSYAFAPQWSANLELLVLSVDTDGGTSNNLLAAVPCLYLRWSYLHWIPGQGDAR